MTAGTLGITGFEASYGWLERHLRRSPVQRSYKLIGKGNATVPHCHTSRMVKICSAVSQNEPCNICNMDESGLYFRMGPDRSYLSA